MDLGSCRGCSGQAGARGGQGFVSATHTVGEYVNPRVKITWSNPTANIAGLMRYSTGERRAHGCATTLGRWVMIIDGLLSLKSKLFICSLNALHCNCLHLLFFFCFFPPKTFDSLLISGTFCISDKVDSECRTSRHVIALSWRSLPYPLVWTSKNKKGRMVSLNV